MIKCPYCNQVDLSEISRSSLWLDVSSKTLAALRLYQEMQGTETFGIRSFARALMHPAERPPANESDRLCPLCRRGHVTRRSGNAIWPDAVVRLFGFGRTYLELRGSAGGFGLRELAVSLVEGDDIRLIEPEPEAMKPPPRRRRPDFEPKDEVDQSIDPDLVFDTPFDGP